MEEKLLKNKNDENTEIMVHDDIISKQSRTGLGQPNGGAKVSYGRLHYLS